MSLKRVVLTLDGDLTQGFQVRLTLGSLTIAPSVPATYTPLVETTGQLPPDPALGQALQDWQQVYHQLLLPTRALRPQRIRHDGSLDLRTDCRRLGDRVIAQFQRWLQTEPFQPINLRLREELHRDEPIQLLIRSSNPDLAHLPWHRWDFVERYGQVEVAFSPPDADRLAAPTPDPTAGKVRILAILGHSAEIDVSRDRALLQALPDADVTFLVEPDRGQLTDHLWEQPWDILFFAGHSTTEAQAGRLYINATDTLTIDELRYGLQRAIAQGLQLAIFNSCDGLGLAQALGDLQLPQMIVMREPVPDAVAQQFLLYFLQAFAAQQPFYQAVRQARERLQGSEQAFPCASWLPMVYQQSTALPPSWADLAQRDRPTPHRPNPLLALVGGGLVAALVVAARLAGLLQGAELAAYDQLMRLKPDQGLDDRLLIVEVTARDVADQDPDERGEASLSNAALEQVLEKLLEHQPRAVVLDIYREARVGEGHENLVDLLQRQQVVFPCSQPLEEGFGVRPPPELQPDQYRIRLGFTNFPADDDDVVRRQSLYQVPATTSNCPAEYSLALQGVRHYLHGEGIGLEWTDESISAIQFQETVFPRLHPHFGGYQGVEDAGEQIMLNYRSSAQGVAPRVSLGEVLTDQVDPSWIEGRLVLIGTVDPSFKDDHLTAGHGKMRGLHIHAHAASQLLSAVLDGQPLIWTWSNPAEMAWIVAWGVTGGGIAWGVQSLKKRSLAIATGIVLLYGGSYGLFLLGGWVPLVPAVLALTGGVVGGAMMPSLLSRTQTND